MPGFAFPEPSGTQPPQYWDSSAPAQSTYAPHMTSPTSAPMTFPGGPFPDTYSQTQHVQPSATHSFQSQSPTRPQPLIINDSPFAMMGPSPAGYQATSPPNTPANGYYPQSTPSSPIQAAFNTPVTPSLPSYPSYRQDTPPSSLYPSYSSGTPPSSSYPTYSSDTSSPTSFSGMGGYSTAHQPQQIPTQGSSAEYYGNTANTVALQPAYNGYAPTSPTSAAMSQQQTRGFPGQYQQFQRDDYSSQDPSRIPPGESMNTIDSYM